MHPALIHPALAPVLGAGITVAACYATGALLMSILGVNLRRLEKFPLAFVLGAACLHLMLFALLSLRIAYRPVLLALLTGLIATFLLATSLIASSPLTGAWRWKKTDLGGGPASEKTRRDPSMLGFAIIFAVFTVFYFVNAWAPEASADGSGYHLEFVARYLRAHGFERITTNMYATLSEGVELLYLPAFAIGKHSAAALVHLTFSVALALAIFAYGDRIGRPWAGAAAALLTYVSPVVAKDGTSAYIDMGVAAIGFSVFYLLEIWDAEQDARLLIPIGLVAGYAYAAKYTAFVMLLYALGFVAWKARKMKPLMVVAGCAAVMMAPWIVKNWIYVQNPVAPFANQIFRNPYFHVLTEQEWSGYLRNYGVESRWTLPVEVTMRGAKTQGVIGPVFLAAPLALLALRFRAGRRLLIAGFLLLSTYFMNVGTRFLIPCLPFFSLAMALALSNARVLLGLLVLIQAATAWPRELRLYADPEAWRLEHFPLQAALRNIPEDQYLRRISDFYAVAKMIEENVPPGERVLSTGGAGAQSYTSREILVDYEGALNRLLADALQTGWLEAYEPSRRLVFRFPERGVRRIRLVETARGEGPQQWTVHELRFLHAGAELPRESAWRLRAFPNPWEVQLAFDNSPVTRWSSWETAKPGMYIDVDFGRAELVNEVNMETSHAYEWPIQLRVEAMNENGEWIKIADKPEEQTMRPRGSLRRAATYEMQQRGVNYLLVGDRDYGSEYFREDPESWGLTEVARIRGMTLYHVTPVHVSPHGVAP